MAYSVDNIIPVSILLTPAGLSFANFSSAFGFGVDADLQSTGSLSADTYKDYNTLDEVKEDFTEGSPPELMARRWFAQIPKPPQISIWIWDPAADSPAEVAAKANEEAWRYWYFFPHSVFDPDDADYTEADVTALADWADANIHPVPFVTTEADAVDPQVDTDLASVLAERGNRRMFIGYRKASTVSDDASQAYAMTQLAAAFHKFNPEGARTAITGEFQVLPGVVGESLTTTAYNALTDKKCVFFTEIELQGSTDASRVINSQSPSSFGEFIDDVVNIDVLKNRLQVNGYNYLANAGTKRPLTPRGYAGLLKTMSETLKGFYDNGVLGRLEYTHPTTGNDEIAKYGYVILNSPEDVFDLSSATRRDREFPVTNIIALLARAGHRADISVSVE